MCGNNLSDETKLGGRDSTDQEDEEQRVVAGMWTSHLQLRWDIVIGQCIVFPVCVEPPTLSREHTHIIIIIIGGSR